MDIHVVQLGDTIYSIADNYGVTAANLIRANGLTEPEQLIPGETIVITYPSQTYYIQEGDTLASIANSHHITVTALLRNNPFLVDMDYIYPGEELVIRYHKKGWINTHGYANTFINRAILQKTLPYLTYLTVFNYRVVRNGEIEIGGDDSDIIEMSKTFAVLPLILLTTLTVRGEVDLEITYEVLINEEIQNRLFDNIISIIREKGYYGVNISAQYITSSNQELFNNYTRRLSTRLKEEDYITVITVNPKIDYENHGVVYENIDYTKINNEVDAALFLQYKWGFSYGPPSPVNSHHSLSVFLDYALTQLEVDKIHVGIPTIGYDWELPYVAGYSKASSLNLDSIINLARVVGANIEFDERSKTPFFRYTEEANMTPHEVWFVNAITINELIKMKLDKGISCTGIWNIMIFYSQLWLVINSQYQIVKLLPEY